MIYYIRRERELSTVNDLSMIADKTWCESYSGKQMFLLDLKPESIVLEDVAHSIAYQCRYNGHTSEMWAVALHSLEVARRVREIIESEVHPYRPRIKARFDHDGIEMAGPHRGVWQGGQSPDQTSGAAGKPATTGPE